jgi:hypothetical protein
VRVIPSSPMRSSFVVVAVVQSDRRAGATFRPDSARNVVSGAVRSGVDPHVRSVSASARVIAI